jgi:hypothetical protein
MKHISELMSNLNQHFHWNKARINCFAHMLLALLTVRTVNLSEIAVAFDTEAQVGSRYKRLQRFFRYMKIDYVQVACWIFKLFFPQGGKFYLTVDRTNWFWGKAKINILTLAVAYEGLAIPLFWQCLDKAGNATAAEHRGIVERFINVFGKECIAGVLADREFASGELFQWFNEEKIAFYIRIKEDSLIRVGGKKICKASNFFSYFNPKTVRVFPMSVWLYGQKVNLAGAWSEDRDLMIVATNQTAENAISIYLRRWEVENLFQSLKNRGFRFEATHMTHLERIEKLTALLAIGFCWAHKVGEWRALIKPIRWNKHKEGTQRPQNSFFRYGFDYIRETILFIHRKKWQFKRCLKQLIVPISPPMEAAA